ncbi:hypothetical protein K504DRAFT_527535 [Pleomassaria siparia CBS 279.74]|uniref:Uncharacterized protein n=1 Tax=Pleomassaria siparia CBS 279.74 TaxID=1314801 RepID=A0A6G1K5I5_9PLEO|nr:hypothetical protein K504DRAFT_527535 [Pleomassaria siparia CBS 279.74]
MAICGKSRLVLDYRGLPRDIDLEANDEMNQLLAEQDTLNNREVQVAPPVDEEVPPPPAAVARPMNKFLRSLVPEEEEHGEVLWCSQRADGPVPAVARPAGGLSAILRRRHTPRQSRLKTTAKMTIGIVSYGTSKIPTLNVTVAYFRQRGSPRSTS